MTTTKVPTKSRSKLWLIVAAVVIVVGVGIYLSMDWASFKQGFNEGFAAGSKK